MAFLTLSVSVALTLLVPLVANGYLKREDTIPYIAGANITTLADTLVAAILLGNPDAVRVVLAEVIGVAIVTVAPAGRRLSADPPAPSHGRRFVLSSREHLAAFAAFLLVVPVVLDRDLTAGVAQRALTRKSAAPVKCSSEPRLELGRRTPLGNDLVHAAPMWVSQASRSASPITKGACRMRRRGCPRCSS